MESVEREIRDIFEKRYITESDVERANKLINDWKVFMNWKEQTIFPIRA